jgi:hypothetical protein
MEILHALNNEMLVGISCDLRKALDCLNHGTVLSELSFCGVQSTTLMLV